MLRRTLDVAQTSGAGLDQLQRDGVGLRAEPTSLPAGVPGAAEHPCTSVDCRPAASRHERTLPAPLPRPPPGTAASPRSPCVGLCPQISSHTINPNPTPTRRATACP